MTDFIDSFLEQLEADKPKPHADYSKLAKLTMSSQDNQGTVMFAPFMNPENSKPYEVLNGVREIRMSTSLFKDGNDEVWIRILSQDKYGNLTDEQKALYDEVAGLFDQYYEMVDANEKMNTWDIIRYRSYSLFQGIILNHANTSGAIIAEHNNLAALLIYPSKMPISAMSDAIASKIANSKGSKAWLPAVFAPSASGREGAISIQFTRKTDNQVGYNTAVAFEFNSSFNTVIDPNLQVPEDTLKLFGNLVSEFLGWQNGDNGLFNEKLFKELKSRLAANIKVLEVGATPSNEAPAPENKNGVDPMINTNSTPAATPTPEPAAQTTPAPDHGVPESKPADDFPF